MSVTNSTLPFRLEEIEHRGYYIPQPAYYNPQASQTDFEAVTEPFNIAAHNGINGTLQTVRQAKRGYWATFSVSNGSCANSSYEYLDRQREQGTCFSTCHEPNTLFLPFNLETCMQLATIAALTENGTLEVDRSGDTNSVVESFGIEDLTAWDGIKIINDVVQCVLSSCDDNPIGSCPPSVRGLSNIAVSAENLQEISQGLDHFCDNFEAKLNPDIAGPGVSACSQSSSLVGSGWPS